MRYTHIHVLTATTQTVKQTYIISYRKTVGKYTKIQRKNKTKEKKLEEKKAKVVFDFPFGFIFFFLKFLAQESPFSSVQINTYPYICNMYVYMYLCRQTFIETEFHMCIKICVDYLLLFLHSIIFLLHVCVPHFLWVVNNTCYSRCWFVFFFCYPYPHHHPTYNQDICVVCNFLTHHVLSRVFHICKSSIK